MRAVLLNHALRQSFWWCHCCWSRDSTILPVVEPNAAALRTLMHGHSFCGQYRSVKALHLGARAGKVPSAVATVARDIWPGVGLRVGAGDLCRRTHCTE